uniref:Filamin n=1 Tax=Acrobeloides nanus TaxID=290746 RepID=A0A914CJJ2_9BILA
MNKTILDDSGHPIDVKIREHRGKIICEYTTRKVGEHRLEVYINGRPIDSGPLFVSAYDSRKISIKPLAGGAAGQPVQFLVDAVEAGKGQLEISVNQGKVPNNVQMQGAGRCLVTFIPQHPGTYVIDVTFNGHQVHGCPIRVEVHTKQVGKQVTAPFSPTSIIPTGGAGIAGSPPPRPASSDRSYQTSPIGPPRVDTSYSVTSTSSSRNIESPRSPTLLRHIRRPSSEQHSPQPTYREDQYPRSARLIREHVSPPPEKRERTEVGFTVAQY